MIFCDELGKKVMNKILSLIILGLIHTTILRGANMVRGSELQSLGSEASSLAVAGAYTTEADIPSLVALNPALGASFLRPNLSVNYTGMFSNLNYFSVLYSQPTLYGVFSLAYRGEISSGFLIGNVHSIETLFSKDISLRFKFGFGLGLDLASTSFLGSSYSATGIHAQMAVLYQGSEPLDKTLGIGRLRLGAQIKQAGLFPFYTITNTVTTIKTLDLRAGVSFDWLKLGQAKSQEGGSPDFFKSRFLFDVGVTPYPLNLTLNGALKNTFYLNTFVKSICLSGGAFLGTTNVGILNLGPWSLGLGFVFDFSPTDLSLQYSVIPDNSSSQTTLYHSLAISIALGKKDVSKPQIDLGEYSEGTK